MTRSTRSFPECETMIFTVGVSGGDHQRCEVERTSRDLGSLSLGDASLRPPLVVQGGVLGSPRRGLRVAEGYARNSPDGLGGDQNRLDEAFARQSLGSSYDARIAPLGEHDALFRLELAHTLDMSCQKRGSSVRDRHKFIILTGRGAGVQDGGWLILVRQGPNHEEWPPQRHGG